LNTVSGDDLSLVFVELGVATIAMALVTRLANRLGLSAIPLYLLAGLAFGKGGLVPLRFSEDFVHVVAEIGVLLLLFMLGLEYSGEELAESLKGSGRAGFVDFALNFTPGLVMGRILGWGMLPSILLGGVTWVSSSGIVSGLIWELHRKEYPETPTIVSILVVEDLAMAVYLPMVAVLLTGRSLGLGLLSVAIALTTVLVVLFVAIRFGKSITRLVEHQPDDVILFSTLGLMLLVAGVSQRLQVSAAIGAFLVGIAISGPVVRQARRQLGPMRDLFAATFFLFFGLQIDPKSLPPVLGLAGILAVVTIGTKIAVGAWAARRAGVDRMAGMRAGAALVARGEFSVVIAGLGVSLEPQLGALAAAYVLIMAVVGPLLTRFIEPMLSIFPFRLMHDRR
jgi:CPA2 family monovalent cation:H+ antiporter-2